MKVVKLNNRYKYFQYGFTHALRFDYEEWNKCRRYERWLEAKYGSQPWYQYERLRHQFMTYSGNGSYKRKNVPYWLLIRNEIDITAMLLSVEYN